MRQSPSTSVVGFTGNRETWLRNDGGARQVLGVPKPYPRVAKWLQVQLRRPVALAPESVALLISNHLFKFAVGTHKIPTTGTWHT